MFKPFSLFLGLRYVSSRQGNGFSSFISASSTLGIALGVMVLIVVLSAMNGFERELSQRLLSIIPHAEMVTVSHPIDDWEKSVIQVEKSPDVIAAAPVIKVTGMMQFGAELKGIEVRGVDVDKEQQVSDIATFVIDGKWEQLKQENSVIIGAGVAKKLNVDLGETVQLLLPKLNESSNAKVKSRFPAMIKRNVTVVGIFKFGGTIDEGLVYINLAQAADVMNYSSGQAQGIRLKVNDVFQAPKIVRYVANEFDYYVYIYDWTRTQGHIYKDIELVRMVMFIVLVLVIGVASFNIVSTLIMAVNEKKGDIAILKTMGASSSLIMSSFMIQGLVNGILGCLGGALAGGYLAFYLTDVLSFFEGVFGSKVLASDIYFINFIPTELHQDDIFFTVITALILSFLATLYPAWRATKVDPAQVLGQV